MWSASFGKKNKEGATSMRKILLLVCIPLCLLANPTVKIELTKIHYDQEKNKIYIQGFVPLRDGTAIQVGISFHGMVGLWKVAYVKQGGFQVVISLPNKQIVPGKYTIFAQFNPKKQSRRIYLQLPKKLKVIPAKSEVYLGNPKEEQQEVQRIRQYLLNTLDILREVYSQLVQQGGYLLAQVKMEYLRSRGKLPHSLRYRLLRKWERFTQEHWRNVYRIQRYNFYRYKKIRFLSPFPKVEQAIHQLFVDLYKLYVAYTREIYQKMGRKLPSHLSTVGVFGIPRIKRKLEKTAKQAYTELGEKDKGWYLSSLREGERGAFSKDRNTYTSYVMKFSVTKPSSWMWNFSPVSPTTRLRIFPVTPELRGKVVAAIEIQDFPLAESFRDLEKLVEIRTRNRYSGFRKIYSRPIQAPDPTMPKGVRPGYDMLFEAKDRNRHFTIRQYYLFCRWHKRIYGVLTIAAKGYYEKVKKEVEKICKSFRILDAPQFKSLREKEKQSQGKEK